MVKILGGWSYGIVFEKLIFKPNNLDIFKVFYIYFMYFSTTHTPSKKERSGYIDIA